MSHRIHGKSGEHVLGPKMQWEAELSSMLTFYMYFLKQIILIINFYKIC